ncbi:MAG: peptidoglycan DD-metalloendopeptidase family protein [Prevotella sp.]|jgi:murein DD-endopeptidase MepM/ murein hydrolase activator NlpD|nr:peptidoglycan DD-metalloendopeptidase family protein [Prevotella sp.]
METFLLYILKSSACLTVFYICVKAFLSNETFYRFNRLVILAGTAICFILPFIEINIQEYSPVQKPFVLAEEALVTKQTPNPEIYQDEVIALPDLPEPENATLSIGAILLLVYLTGGGINLAILMKSVYSMCRLIHGGRKILQGRYVFVIVSPEINPFSWGRYVVLSESDYDSDHSEIIIHETAHIERRHSFDLIYMELIALVQWFNPAVWLLKRELKDIHEYQADIRVLQSGIDATKYQLLLVKKAVGASSYTLANSFNHSKIKKRITMMLKEKSNKWARLKLLLLLPLGVLSVYAFARLEVNGSPDPIGYDKGTNNLGNGQNDDIPLSVIAEKDFCFPLPSMVKVTGKYERGKNGGFHFGYDLQGRGKDEVVAAFDGNVVVAEYDKARGNFIKIEHADGLSTLYAHNSKNLVKPNTFVKAGAVIAITGNTGFSTGDHLHFEIGKKGKPIDPGTVIDFEKKALRQSVPALQGRQKPVNYIPPIIRPDGEKLSDAEYNRVRFVPPRYQ